MTSDWKSKTLGDLCDIALGRTPARDQQDLWDGEHSSGNVWLSIADLLRAEDNIVVDSKEYISDKGAAQSRVVTKGALLVSFKLTLGRLAFAGCDLYTNEAIAALTIRNEQELSREFLFYFLHFFDWDKATEGDVKVKGKTLNKAKLQKIVVCYPTLPEQKRLVNALDALFDDVATATANAERNVANARALFESELQAALDHPGTGWTETTLGAEVDLLAGFAFKSARYTEDAADPRLLRGDNIVPGALRWDDVKRWPASEAAEFERFQLAVGDVVLAMDRPWVSAGLKRAQITPADLPSLLVQRTARLRGKAMMDNRFLYYLVGCDAFVRHILGVQTGSGVPHISSQQIKSFSFRRPPRSEQRRIAERLDALSTDTMRLAGLNARKRVALRALRASVLSQALTSNLRSV